jgi:YVTN family beta-propeller protein
LALLAGGAVFAFTRLSAPPGLPGIDGRAVGVIDADAAVITHQYPLGFEPGAMTAGGDSVWVADPRAGTVARIPRKGDRVPIIPVGRNPAGLAFGAGSLWVAGGDDGELAQVDASENRTVRRTRIGNGLGALAVDYGAVWAATAQDGEVVRFDLRSGRIVKRITVGGRPIAIATGAGAVWVAAEDANVVVPIDPRSNQPLAQIGVGNGPSAVAVGLGAVWVANRQDGTVSRIDPATERVTDTIPAGREPVGMSLAGGALWVADATGTLRHLDPGARAIVDTVRTGGSPAQLTTAGDDLWATFQAPPAAHRGGTLRIGWAQANLDPGYDSYDGFSFPVLQLAYDGLLGYRRESGVAGTRLVGDLATAVPSPTDGGRSYTFRLRPGLRFSDGRPVRASDFRASMQRMPVKPRRSPPLYNAIEGAGRCRSAPTTCDLSRGIVTDDRTGTITLHLRRPDPGLLPLLAGPLAAVVPATAPPEPARSPLPGTGPYRVERIERGRRVLTRNPYFRPRDGRPAGFADRIEVMLGGDEPHIRAVEREQLDFSPVFELSARRLAALRLRVGARLQSAANTFTEYAWLNVHTRPFDDPRGRQALNLALDRHRLVADAGGPDSAAPTCQILAPGMPGWRPACHFTIAASPAGGWTAPDLAQARRLVAASPARGSAVEVWVPPWLRPQADPIARALEQLGFRSRVRVSDYTPDGPLPPQLTLSGWIADSPDSAAFLRALVSCKPDAVGDGIPHLCGYGVDAAIDRAQAAGPAAGDAWRRVEDLIAAHAPVVPLINRRALGVFSKRTGNIHFPPLAGVYFEQLWVR